ncbi:MULTISPECIES: FAD-dependent oxidoreductase [Glycomyces]|uniref:2-polyprenyl-6-methoxyphenol hydroxylase-like FAD-dependent oxidoreductase n=2 Tax=Glycomyces TaxID=58113 RepID=A0A9X3PM89_9ACTN|nr:NAD(P)/FAD-dependent oxidoreductase [Glycomyces lechevalierae]MDA1386539.1 NAD(P)/FAD-dependent oxidoreductase [Glycomyces lechevalierae]MDR7340606.1 2-polyprenyl-6-methoxyphenol hydroxylase-like FAD-dependent oxidoreductase [Glycomyces lechevalierae]
MNDLRTIERARTAIVIGGGVAGPVAALALQKAGIEATVFEAYKPGTGSRGGPLGLASNGLNALGVVGADRVLADAGIATPRMIIHSGSGKVLGTVESSAGLPTNTTLPRGRLTELLQAHAESSGIRFVYGRRFVDAVDTGRSVIAQFDDHTTAEADVLIGCDGIRSAVRASLDPASPKPRYTGLIGLGGFSTADPLGATDTGGSFHMVFGRRAFFGHVSDGTRTGWFANLPFKTFTREQLRETSFDGWIALMRKLFADDNSAALTILDHVTPETFIPPSPLEDLPHVPVWSKGRIALIGDAAHATSPSSGQGASLAAESAVELARCLRDLPVAQAFQAYEDRRRDRVERVIATAARTNQSKAAGPVAARFRDALMPFFMERFTTPEKMAWQYAHTIDWDEPARAARSLCTASRLPRDRPDRSPESRGRSTMAGDPPKCHTPKMDSPSAPAASAAADPQPSLGSGSAVPPLAPVPPQGPPPAKPGRSARLVVGTVAGAALFLAGLGVGIAIGDDPGGDDGSSDLEAVKEECAAGSSDIRVGDGGETLTIDRMGAAESPGATFTQFDCIVEELGIPDSVLDRIENTRALDGYQDASFAEYAASWTYHPDDGLNMTITVAG